MKLMIPAVLAALFVSACDWADERKTALADAALIQIQLLNAQGIDPVRLDAEELAILASGCAMVSVVYPERAADVAAFCGVAMEAAK